MSCILCSYSYSSNVSMEKLLSIIESVKWQLRVYLLFERDIACGCFVFKIYTYPRFINTGFRLNMKLINQINYLDSSFWRHTLRFLDDLKNKSYPLKIVFNFSIFATDYSYLIRYHVYYTIIINIHVNYYYSFQVIILNFRFQI